MPSNKVYKFDSMDDLQWFLNGGIIGAPVDPFFVSGFPLAGLTLTFTSPVDSLVFSSGSLPGGLLSAADVAAQVQASITGVVARFTKGRILLVESSPTNGVALSANDEEAKKVLGFDYKNAVTGKVYAPPGAAFAAPCWVWIGTVNESTFVLHTWE